MTKAEKAFEAAKRLIEDARVSGASSLDLDVPETRALEQLPDSIAALKDLRTLDCDNTQIHDLGPLSGLTGLTGLWLNETPVSELGPLSGLTGLTGLWLNGAPVSALGPLSGLTGLTTLLLSGTSVSELGPLSGLTGLAGLLLDETSVSELGPLSGLTGLTTLLLNGTSVSELGPLSGLTGLTGLWLDGTSVSELGPLSGLTGLTSLGLNGTSVSDLDPLSGLTGLTSLGLNGTSVSDLDPLSGLTGLTSLGLNRTPVSDLRPLQGLSGLVESPNMAGLTFGNSAATSDPRIGEFAEIKDHSDRARTLFDYLKDWVPLGDGATVSNANPPQTSASLAVVRVKRANVAEIRKVLRESYPDLRARSARLVELVQQQKAIHALLPTPNDDDAWALHQKEKDFLDSMEAGLVSFHQDLPEMPEAKLSDAEVRGLRDRLLRVATLADKAVQYLDKDRGTYGGLYKIGLITALGGLLSLIPGVGFLAGAAIPGAVLGAHTVSLEVRRNDEGPTGQSNGPTD